MIKVGNRFFLGLKIDGKEVPLEDLAFDSLQLHSNRLFYCPIGNITIVDSQQYFEKNPVGDGVRFEIFTGTEKDPAKAKVYKFRHFKTEEIRVGGNTNSYKFRLIYNCPRFINESMTNVIVGNASEVIQTIGQQIPFSKIIVDPSSDAMPWVAFGKKRCEFVRHVIEHAYTNNNSCFMGGITLDGTFLLKNVTAINITQNNNLLLKGSSKVDGSIKILVDKEVTNSGVTNNYSGYKMATIEQGTEADAVYSKVTVPTSSKQVLINENIAKGIESATFINTPIKSSNIHPNYQNAFHQNKRIKNTYSLSTYIVTDEMTGLDLFDPITYLSLSQAQGKIQANAKISGSYLIFAKTLYATNKGTYFEKFQVSRQGYNLDSVSPSQMKAALSQ